ncbi:integrase/recombinase XerC/integrase/recombinase XerD [Bacillus sp. OV194]|nr:integrase/recombinase XerC/integrase/recombinase XerD [Bacillus sp. OV194]
MITSEACIKRFIDDYSFKLEKNTLEGYKISIRLLLSFSKKAYNEVTTRDIRNWLAHLEEDRYKISTIRTKMFGLRLFYQYCLEEELIAHNPVEAIPLPNNEDKLPHYLTMDQLTQLKLLSEGNLKQRAVIEVLYSTGTRISELINMKLEDIQWSERMIRIPKGKGKKERIVLFTKDCSEHLNAYLNVRRDDLPYVFLNGNGTGAIDNHNIQVWFRVFQKKLGFYVTPHTLRHTFAAHLVMKGMPLECIQALLGHDKLQNTHIYTRLYSQAQKQMYDEWM